MDRAAHSHPLSLFFRSACNATTIDDASKRVLSLLTKHRWKLIDLDLRASGPNVLSILLEFLDDLKLSNLKMLESFSLTSSDLFDFSLPNSLRRAPKLKTLNLYIAYD